MTLNTYSHPGKGVKRPFSGTVLERFPSSCRGMACDFVS
jgi:hypothetical protein